jgi:hypothetical protein
VSRTLKESHQSVTYSLIECKISKVERRYQGSQAYKRARDVIAIGRICTQSGAQQKVHHIAGGKNLCQGNKGLTKMRLGYGLTTNKDFDQRSIPNQAQNLECEE